MIYKILQVIINVIGALILTIITGRDTFHFVVIYLLLNIGSDKE